MFSGLARDGVEGRPVSYGRYEFYINQLYRDNSADDIDYADNKYVRSKTMVNDSGVISNINKIYEVGMTCSPGKISTISGNRSSTAANNSAALIGGQQVQREDQGRSREVFFRYYHFVYNNYNPPLTPKEYPEVTRFVELTNVIIPYTARSSVSSAAAKQYDSLGATITCGLDKSIMDYFADMIRDWEQPIFGNPMMQTEQGATYAEGHREATVLNAYLPGITDEDRAAVERGEADPEDFMSQAIDFNDFYWMQCKFSVHPQKKVIEIVDENDKTVELGSLIERFIKIYKHDPALTSLVCNAKVEIKTHYGMGQGNDNVLNTEMVHATGGKVINLSTPKIKVKIIGMNFVDWVAWSHHNDRASGGSIPRRSIARSMRNANKFSKGTPSIGAQLSAVSGSFSQQMEVARKIGQPGGANHYPQAPPSAQGSRPGQFRSSFAGAGTSTQSQAQPPQWQQRQPYQQQQTYQQRKQAQETQQPPERAQIGARGAQGAYRPARAHHDFQAEEEDIARQAGTQPVGNLAPARRGNQSSVESKSLTEDEWDAFQENEHKMKREAMPSNVRVVRYGPDGQMIPDAAHETNKVPWDSDGNRTAPRNSVGDENETKSDKTASSNGDSKTDQRPHGYTGSEDDGMLDGLDIE